jgi:hypothetical protein
MTLDVASQNWTATYAIPDSASLRRDLQVVILASDGANPPNTGQAFSTMFAFEETPTTPPPPKQSSGFDVITVGLVAVITLIAGLAVGVAISRRRRGGKPAGAEAPEKGAPEDEWEVREGGSK